MDKMFGIIEGRCYARIGDEWRPCRITHDAVELTGKAVDGIAPEEPYTLDEARARLNAGAARPAKGKKA